MSAAESIRSRLPSLYRPEPGESGIVSDMLAAVGDRIDTLHQLSAFVLQQHWFHFADKRTFSPTANLMRERAQRPVLLQGDLMVVADAMQLLTPLKSAARPIDVFVVDALRPATADLLDAWDGAVPPPVGVQRALIDDLHRIARSDLYDADRFAGIALDPDLVAEVVSGIGGSELTRRNRDLLLAAYPDGLAAADHDWPTIRDLARIGSLASVPPRTAPPVLRDTVESYRTRIARIVALYRNGLGTLGALRSMTEAQLPPLPADASEGPDRPFSVEEWAPITTATYAPHPPGPPEGAVGPLMSWNLSNSALTPSPPTLLITGAAPGKCVQPANRPMIELYRVGAAPVRIAIGYDDTVAPGDTLRLRPAAHRFVIAGGELLGAASLPSEETPADPTVTDGAATAVAGGPGGCTAMAHGPDGMLWVGTETGAIHRWDGATWTERGTVGGVVHQLVVYDFTLLIAAADGLHRIEITTPDPPVPVAGLPAGSVNRLWRAPDGAWWYATDNGIQQSAAIGDAATDIRTDGRYLWVGADDAGALLLGGDDGLLHYDAGNDVAHRYWGIEFSETEPDWDSADGPAVDSGLPAVICARRDRTGTLWIGTEEGLAAYVAEPVRPAVYHTRLRAWPDLVDGQVFAIEPDQRGHMWFATNRGLFRFDGRDMHHQEGGVWVSYRRWDQRADGSPRGAWRYHRAAALWQYYDEVQREWRDNDLAVRTAAEDPATAVIWCDGVSGDIGALSGDGFVPSSAVADGALFMRYKSDEETIHDGGIPFIPRVPPGASTWRYLRREESPLDPPANRPWWSCEGRRFPPPLTEPTPPPGRFGKADAPPPANAYDDALFAYDAEAEVSMAWNPSSALTVLVRLVHRAGEAGIDPAVLDVVWNGLQKVRPAGVRVSLAVGETIVRK
ncbi:hypothetical protein JCM12296A_45070 [Desulfosarcina cetonica]